MPNSLNINNRNAKAGNDKFSKYISVAEFPKINDQLIIYHNQNNWKVLHKTTSE